MVEPRWNHAGTAYEIGGTGFQSHAGAMCFCTFTLRWGPTDCFLYKTKIDFYRSGALDGVMGSTLLEFYRGFVNGNCTSRILPRSALPGGMGCRFENFTTTCCLWLQWDLTGAGLASGSNPEGDLGQSAAAARPKLQVNPPARS